MYKHNKLQPIIGERYIVFDDTKLSVAYMRKSGILALSFLRALMRVLGYALGALVLIVVTIFTTSPAKLLAILELHWGDIWRIRKYSPIELQENNDWKCKM